MASPEKVTTSRYEDDYEESIVQVDEPDFISEFVPPHALHKQHSAGSRGQTAPFTITVMDRPHFSAGPLRRPTAAAPNQMSMFGNSFSSQSSSTGTLPSLLVVLVVLVTIMLVERCCCGLDLHSLC
jgi:hypothetical protein